MDKLTNFVSKSFELNNNNNNRKTYPATEQLQQTDSVSTSCTPEPIELIKQDSTEEENLTNGSDSVKKSETVNVKIKTDTINKPRNWLISDLTDNNQNSTNKMSCDLNSVIPKSKLTSPYMLPHASSINFLKEIYKRDLQRYVIKPYQQHFQAMAEKVVSTESYT